MKKTMSLFAVMMISLLVVGLSYAVWSKTLTISGEVNTGSLDWQFVAASCLDTSGNDYNCRDGFAGPPPLFWTSDKDVGITSVEITDPHTVTVTLANVYPSYFASINVYAVNTGTIPLIIDKVLIGDVEIRKSPTPIVKLDLNEDGMEDIEIWWLDGFGAELKQGEMSPAMTFWAHILEDAPEGATLTFAIEVVAVQWNMYVPPQ
jgi:hypothetical protein